MKNNDSPADRSKRSAGKEKKSTDVIPPKKVAKIANAYIPMVVREPTNASGGQSTSAGSDVIQSSQNVQSPLTDGVYLSKVECLGTKANGKARSLFEVIRSVRPIASIHFNFCIDPHWVLRQYPHGLRDCPISFVVGQGHLASLIEQCAQFPNVQSASAQLPFPYGTHHSKLSLFESESAIHAMVGTANLVEEDWALKSQAFYYCAAKFSDDLGDNSGQCFRDDLVDYLRRAYQSPGKANKLVEYWLQRIVNGGANFSHIKDRLVGSIPGRFQRNSTKDVERFGHMRLRSLLSEKFTEVELRDHKTFIGQFSSIGSLGAKPETWLCDEFLTSLSGTKSMRLPSALKIVYPSVENVRNSFEGYAAGLSLPYNSDLHKRQLYLEQFMHQWKSERYHRSLASPHVKSYTALSADGEPQWLLITSANLSCSAWGKLEKNGTQLFVRSYELGVLICAKDHPELAEAGLPVPFDLPLTKYAREDQPFLVDRTYKNQTDTFGYRGAVEVRMANT